MFIRARKTVFIKIVKKNPHLKVWPDLVTVDRGKCLHIDRHFIQLEANTRVYRFTPYRTSYFSLEFIDRDSRYIFTELDAFRAKLAKAMFQSKETAKILV